MLRDWGAIRSRFIKVFPREYRRALAELAAANRKAAA
jgi:glutamate synthase domain-containing protein 3